MTSIRLFLFLFVLIGGLTGAASAQIEDLAHEIVGLSSEKNEWNGKTSKKIVTSKATHGAFNGVVLHGWAEADSLEGFVRFESDGGWTDWNPLVIVRSVTTPAFYGGFNGAVFRDAGSFEISFASDSPAPVLVTQVGTFDSRLDEIESSPTEEKESWFTRKAIDLVPPPDLYRRTDWNADPFRGTPSSLGNIRNLTFHHAAGFTANNLAEGLAQVKAIQVFHQDGRGWSDIGYQFVIDRAGNTYQGRPFLDESATLSDIPSLALGAHVGGANTGNIGICLLGCYHPPETTYACNDVITPESYDAYVHLMAFLRQSYGVAAENIYGHRDYFGTTSCPGDNNYALLPQLREDVERALTIGLREIPDDYSLAGNFPNPFSDETYIEYFLPGDGNVTVTVFDVLGREVQTLVDEYQEGGRRWRQVRFDGSRLMPGFYLYQVSVEGFSGTVFSETQSMILSR